MSMKRLLIPISLVVTLGAGAAWYLQPGEPPPATGPIVTVRAAEHSGLGLAGAGLFAERCQACHGANAGGSDQGPPLVHKIYEPSHHGDGAFFRAAAQGARSHHWHFGDMPPVDGLAMEDVAKIIVYVRELQRANGIN